MKDILLENSNHLIRHIQYHRCWFKLGYSLYYPDLFGLEYSSFNTRTVAILKDDTETDHYYTPHTTKLLGVYIGFTPSVRLSVCLSVRPSVPPTSSVRSVASTVQDGFFPYLVQMINSTRGCVACEDPWPWPISSRSFCLDLENRVRSVASTVLDGLFSYLVQMITSMRRCVACDELWPWPISSRSFDLDFENRLHSVTLTVLDRLIPYLPQIITAIRGCVAC